MFTPETGSFVSPQWDLASSIIETVAFFFVTIELYGEERLKHLNDSLLQSSTRWRLTFLRILGFYDGEVMRQFIAFGLLGSALVLGMAGLAHWAGADKIRNAFFGLYVIFLICFGLAALVKTTVRLAAIPVSISLWLLARARLKGLLLAIGTLLFLLAKAIVITKSALELMHG